MEKQAQPSDQLVVAAYFRVARLEQLDTETKSEAGGGVHGKEAGSED